MARVTKSPDVRREELLDVALELCMSVGFDSMSVEQITATAGVAKGTFYHYFRSKDDLEAQLVRRFGESLLAHLDEQSGSFQGAAIERLRQLLAAASSWKLERLNLSMSFIPFLYRDENFALKHRLFEEWMNRLGPLIEPILRLGQRDGSFVLTDVEGTARLFTTLMMHGATRLWEATMVIEGDEACIYRMLADVTALWTAEERLLGAAPGSLTQPVDQIAREALPALRTAFLRQIHQPLSKRSAS